MARVPLIKKLGPQFVGPFCQRFYKFLIKFSWKVPFALEVSKLGGIRLTGFVQEFVGESALNGHFLSVSEGQSHGLPARK